MSIEKLSSVLCILFVAFIFITYINKDEEVPKNEKLLSNITNNTASKTNNDLSNTDKIYTIKTDNLYGPIVAVDKESWYEYSTAKKIGDDDKLLYLDLYRYIFYVINETTVMILDSMDVPGKIVKIKILSGDHKGRHVYIRKSDLQR
jgi:hypothetical protein